MSDDHGTRQAGRTLHLIDLDNLVGPHQRIDDARWVVSAYRAAAGIRSGDHAVPRAGFPVTEVTRLWPGCHVVTRCACVNNETGATSAAWCAGRYNRVGVGCGDFDLLPFVKALRMHRVALVVVTPAGKVPRELAVEAGCVVALQRPPAVKTSHLGRGW